MTADPDPDPAPTATDTEGFDDLMAEVMAGSDRFGHRQHVELAWLAVRRHGPEEAAALLCDGIRRAAAAAGAPGKFDAGLTVRWVEAVAVRALSPDGVALDPDPAAFLARRPELLDPALLSRIS